MRVAGYFSTVISDERRGHKRELGESRIPRADAIPKTFLCAIHPRIDCLVTICDRESTHQSRSSEIRIVYVELFILAKEYQSGM